jgi:hypothetical protein
MASDELLIDLGDFVIVRGAPDRKAREFFDYEGEGRVVYARRKADGAIVGSLWLLGDEIDEELGDEEDEFYESPVADRACTEAYIALKKRHRALDGVMRVRWVEIHDRGLRRKGLGAALYVGAAMVAKKDARAAIIADDCYGSHTSREAAHVWSSRTLRRFCDVENNTVAYFTAKR